MKPGSNLVFFRIPPGETLPGVTLPPGSQIPRTHKFSGLTAD